MHSHLWPVRRLAGAVYICGWAVGWVGLGWAGLFVLISIGMHLVRLDWVWWLSGEEAVRLLTLCALRCGRQGAMLVLD